MREKMNIDQLADMVFRWADRQFPERDPQQCWEKLKEEVDELFKSPKDGREYADVFILLLDLAALNGVALEREILTKLEINKMSTWVHDEATGTMRRIKDPIIDSIKMYHYPEDHL